MADRTSAVLGPHVVAADLDFTPELVVVRYDEPRELPSLTWRWWPRGLRWSGYRAVRRGYVLRPLPLRDLLLHQETFAALRRQGQLDLTAVVAVLVGPTALYLPRRALREIAETYRRVNELGAADEPTLPRDDGSEVIALVVTFDSIIRKLERAPFGLSRENVLDLTVRQVQARLRELGEERLEELQTELAIRGGGAL